jgi:hypothetical protein
MSDVGVHRLASGTAAVTPLGRAQPPTPRCMGHRSTFTAHASTGRQQFGSQLRGTNGKTPGPPPLPSLWRAESVLM